MIRMIEFPFKMLVSYPRILVRADRRLPGALPAPAVPGRAGVCVQLRITSS